MLWMNASIFPFVHITIYSSFSVTYVTRRISLIYANDIMSYAGYILEMLHVCYVIIGEVTLYPAW